MASPAFVPLASSNNPDPPSPIITKEEAMGAPKVEGIGDLGESDESAPGFCVVKVPV
jgi:hypothetical protein